MNLFGSSTFRILERSLDGSQMKHQAISQNIANVDTPNYKATQVSFKHTLQEEMNKSVLRAHKTDERHVDFALGHHSPIIKKDRDTLYNHNGNNVDIDLEMAELAKNQIYYNALIERINGRFNSLQTVIRGGR